MRHQKALQAVEEGRISPQPADGSRHAIISITIGPWLGVEGVILHDNELPWQRR
jgi:hypothetical protein